MSGALQIVLIVAGIYFLVQLVVLGLARRAAEQRCKSWLGQCQRGEKLKQNRDSAIHDLERGLAGLPSQNILRRLGSAAPLLGVVLSVFSMVLASNSLIAALNESTDTEGLATKILSLGAGVCAGAALALLNHIWLTILQAEESKFFERALGMVSEEDFRDADERLERVMTQIRGSGDALEKAAGNLDSMLRTARDAMSGMSESCVEAATELKALSTFMKDEISPPIGEFVAATIQLKDASIASARDFTTSMKTLTKQVDQLDKRIGDGLDRQRIGLQSQVDSADSLAASARELHSLLIDSLAPLNNGTLRDFAERVRSVTDELRAGQVSVTAGAEAFMQSTTHFGERVRVAVESVDSAHASVVARVRAYAANAKEFGKELSSTTQALKLAQSSVASDASEFGLTVRATAEALGQVQASVVSGASVFTTSALALGEQVSATACALESAPAAVATGLKAFEEHATRLGERVTLTGDALVGIAKENRDRVERDLSSLTGEVSALREQAASLAHAMSTLKTQLPSTTDALRTYQDSTSEGAKAIAEFATAASAAVLRLQATSATLEQPPRNHLSPHSIGAASSSVDGSERRSN